MKKYLIAAFTLLMISAVNAQKTPPKKTTPVKTTTSKTTASPVLKNATDSLSYAIGLSVANFYKQQGMGKLNSSCVALAINDALSEKKVLLTEDQSNLLLMCHSNPALC